MRLLKGIAVLALLVMTVTLFLAAESNQFGVADARRISFTLPMHVGDVLLPKGEYEVRHTMEGANHIMVFRQLAVHKPAEARVKCNLVPLQAKADQTQKIYVLNAASEAVLHQLIFRGDTAAHVF
jgi:hypothetical protein